VFFKFRNTGKGSGGSRGFIDRPADYRYFNRDFRWVGNAERSEILQQFYTAIGQAKFCV
jgi:hypothetical protein